MGEKREIVSRYVSQGMHVIDAVRAVGIKKSAYYYRPNFRPKGRKTTTHTLTINQERVPNTVIVNEIISLISPEYHDYGYKIATVLLRRKGYIINHKKVRRLMKENVLLHPVPPKAKGQYKQYVNHTVPNLISPFLTVEADIKYVYIPGENRNGFLVSFLCTFCRFIPVWCLEYTMPASRIAELVMEFINHPQVKKYLAISQIKVTIRTDNGPQFIAKILAVALQKAGLQHEFIQPGTPQQNGHIESFHSVLTRLVCQRNLFQNLKQTQSIFSEFYYAYNNTRVMKELLCYSPAQFLELWKSGIVGIKKDKKNREIFFFKEKPNPFTEIGSPSEDVFGLNKINNFANTVLNHLENSPV